MSHSYVLALDTAQQQLGVALLTVDGSKAVSRCLAVGNRHAEHILALIDEVLAEVHAAKSDIALVAFGMGPGSFTGLRVACGVAQGIAWANNVHTAGIVNTEAEALSAAGAAQLPAGTRIAVMNDARMQECYAAVYVTGQAGARPACAVEPVLVKPADAKAWLAENAVTALCGTAHAAYADLFELPEGVTEYPVPDTMIETMARLALVAGDEGRTTVPALAYPLYVRDRVALTMAERARGERL